MSYLARLKKNSETPPVTNQQNQQNLEKGGFAGFAGSVTGDFQKSATPATKPTNALATRASGWVLHYADREPLEVIFAPAITHAEVLATEPDAVAAEPVQERVGNRLATPGERDELLVLVAVIFVDDTDQDKQEAVDAALVDPAGALTCYRAIAAERGITAALPEVRTPLRSEVRTETMTTGCKTCRHLKRPGLSAGYCGGGRDDLPGAYGLHHPLRKLPADHGASCVSYLPHEGADHV